MCFEETTVDIRCQEVQTRWHIKTETLFSLLKRNIGGIKKMKTTKTTAEDMKRKNRKRTEEVDDTKIPFRFCWCLLSFRWFPKYITFSGLFF